MSDRDINSLQLFEQISQEWRENYLIPNIGGMGIFLPKGSKSFKIDSYIRLYNCVMKEYARGVEPPLAEWLKKLLNKETIPYYFLMLFRDAWSFASIETTEHYSEICNYFLNNNYYRDGNGIRELQTLFSYLPRKFQRVQKEKNTDSADAKNKKRMSEELKQLSSEAEKRRKEIEELDSVYESKKRAKQEELNESLKQERERRCQEMNETLVAQIAEERAMRLAEMEQEIKRLREEEIEKIKKTAAYQVKHEADEAYLGIVSEDIQARRKFESALSADLRQASQVFKETAEELIRGLQESTENAVEELRRNAANTVNTVVDTERRICGSDITELLMNFGELQQSLYYNVPEEELGLSGTRIEQYQRRFLRVLNRMGYEHFIPEPGMEFDSAVHETEDGEEPEDRSSRITAVIRYGFKHDGEVCVKAKVKVDTENE